MSEQDTEKLEEATSKGLSLHEGKYSEIEVAIPFASSWTYANVFAFSLSPMDIRISFGEALPDGKAEARAGIVMTPDQAAFLALALVRQINEFEQRFGAIRNPLWKTVNLSVSSQPGDQKPE